jgi:Lar family restriction alleviation protein
MSEKLPKMPELKPCPFCGSHGEEVAVCVEDRDAPKGCEGWFVRCYVCYVETVRDQSREDAVATWNRRSLQRDTWMRAMEVAASAVEALRSSGENSDNWTITRDMAYRDCAAAIRALPMPEGGE